MTAIKRLITTGIITAALVILSALPAFAADAEYVPGEVIVKYRAGTTQVQIDTADRHAGGRGKRHLYGAYKVELDSNTSVTSALVAYSNDPVVEYAQPNFKYSTLTTPNDPYYLPNQWNLRIIGADNAWDIWKGDSMTIIAILDTGVSLKHPDLVAKITTGNNAGYDFVSNDSYPADENGHGTHVAGIAAASTDNNLGVAGLDWKSRIMPVRVLDTSGSGDSLIIANGIKWAADHGADVINMSFGGPNSRPQDDLEMISAIKYAHDKGVVIVAASGNSGNTVLYYPASYDYVISVAATDSYDNKASFSTFNSYVDIAAPGASIASTTPEYRVYLSAEGLPYNYGGMSGTSMASPHVAGLAALIASKNPTWTPDQIEQKIEQSSTDLGNAARDNYYGYGRINAKGAVTTPSLVAVSNIFSGMVLQTQFPPFAWQAPTGALGYGIELLSAPPLPGELNSQSASIYRLGCGLTTTNSWKGDIRGLSAKTYWYRVIAWDRNGFVANFSNVDSFTVPKPTINPIVWRDTTHPDFSWVTPIVSDPNAPISNSGIELLSQPPAPGEENNCAPSRYRIGVGILDTSNIWYGSTAGLRPNTTYYYRIISWNKYGFFGGFSDVKTFLTSDRP